MAKTHFRKILESDYLGGFDLDDGKGGYKDIVVTIRRAGPEQVREVATGKKETCLVLHFDKPTKPMICNVTNAKRIEKLAGSPYLENWIGVAIQLGTERVKAFGDIHNAIRVRQFAPKIKEEKQETIACDDCKKPIGDHMGVPGFTIATATAEKYGRTLCYACSQVAKDKEDEADS